MNTELYKEYLDILKAELVPAMGCTEPIAIAYAAALARRELGCLPQKVTVRASANIIKNVKSVVVPHTGGKHGIAAAAAIGIVANAAEKELQVLSSVTDEQIEEMGKFIENAEIFVEQSEKPYIFNIEVIASADEQTSSAEIAGNHTNVICLCKNGEEVFAKHYKEELSEPENRSSLSVEGIVEFADCVDIEDIRPTLQRQIDFNTAIAEEGLRGNYGANIGKILLSSYGNTVHNRAKAYAAAGSDARMNGCELPVIINSGSGNQGMTASLPVIVYAKEIGASEELLFRALAVSNLITIHLKTGIGRLSAYCGATSAGCGAAAGISYLYGGKYREIAHTVVNSVAINSGMVCDGAKASCAAKIASAVEAGLLGWQMQRNESQFYGGDGIIIKGVENTIKNVASLAREGMKETDKEIIRMMLE